MSTSFFSEPAAFDILPRYGLLQPFLEGSRVLEIGAAGATGGASALVLAELGAGTVLSIDTAEAVSRAAASADHPFVRFEATGLADVPRRAFDLVIATDAASLGVEPAVVSALAGSLAPGGHLVVAFRAPGTGLLDLAGDGAAGAGGAPLYESVVGPLAAEFASVEIFSQAPLVGWVLAAARADEEPEVTFDGTLAGTTQPAHYLAICGEEPCGIGGLDFVAAPPEPLGRMAAGRLEAARARAAELQGRVAELERRVAELESALSRAQQGLRTRDVDPESGREPPAAPADDDSRHASLLMRLAEAEARLAELEAGTGGE